MTYNLSSADPVGMSFWLISMALVAATAFFFIERDRVAGKWKTSLTVSGLVTLIAAVHYFYMRDVWVASGTSPTELRYIDWLLTVPLLMVEFYLVLSAVTKVPARVFWKLLLGSVAMLGFGFAGETGMMGVTLAFILAMLGWAFIVW
jgi:bacteriorhodopsin